MKRTIWSTCDTVEDGELTRHQWEALDRLRDRWDLPDTVEIFPDFGSLSHELVIVDVGSMIIGICGDGSTHS